MKINLPDIEIQPDWTIPGQIKKILEEAGEVAEAIAEEDPVRTIKEALDVMQTCATLINMVQAEWNLPIDLFLREHAEKLERKGYLGFTPEDDEPIPYQVVEEDIEDKSLDDMKVIWIQTVMENSRLEAKTKLRYIGAIAGLRA